MEPLVSIIVPTFNHERYVQATIQSLIRQTYQNLELILIDDGSSDQNVARIMEMREACETRFKRYIFYSRQNAGVATTLNDALSQAHGEFVFLIASDDLVEPDAIEVLVDEMRQSTTLAMVCGDADFIDAKGEKTTLETSGKQFQSFVQYFTADRNSFSLASDFGSYASLLIGNYIPIGSLVRRSIYSVVGNYDSKDIPEDHAMWLKIVKVFQIRFVPRVLAHYRLHGHNAHSVLRPQLLAGLARIIAREKKYAFAQGLRREWERTLFWVIMGLTNNRQHLTAMKCAWHLGWRAFCGWVIRRLIHGRGAYRSQM